MTTRFSYAAKTDVGKVRENNEDCFLARPELGLWLVADGMGGHDCGEVAALLAKQTVDECIAGGQNLVSAIHNADLAIKQAATCLDHGKNMGTTIVACRIDGFYYELAWVGDSRAYLWSNQTLRQITRDHSYVQLLFDNGLISKAEMDTHDQRNVIMQSLGGDPNGTIEVDHIRQMWLPGDRIMLCSDGLTDMVNDNDIASILSRTNDNDQTVVEHLLDAALGNGGIDNVTVVLVSAPQRENVLTRIHRNLCRLSSNPFRQV